MSRTTQKNSTKTESTRIFDLMLFYFRHEKHGEVNTIVWNWRTYVKRASLVLIFAAIEITVFRSRNAAKIPKSPKNDRIFQNNNFWGYKFSRTCQKSENPRKIIINNKELLRW